MINKVRFKKYYFSQRLKRQLDQISNYPLTVVEAPSGFGKTTAIKEYLKENIQHGAMEYWYTCLGEPASIAWRGICELLANVNGEIAANLKNLEMPTMETMLYMTAILRDFKCQAETYLVIDNYQLVDCDIPRELISIFSMHRCPNLHMIFITQQLRTKQQFSVHNAGINAIDSSAFFFDREGTLSLFRMEGIRLSDEELESVFQSTEGWVSAIRLQIINYQETGSFDKSADIEHLVETAIWKRLTPEEKNFLLSVSVLDSFTVRQASIMLGQLMLPENIEDMLKTNDFIRYFPDRNSYTIHSILQDYLRNRFYHHQPENFQRQILRLAGQSCAAISQYFLAAQFFYKIKDYDAILSIPFDGQYLGDQKENNVLDFIVTVIHESPIETLQKYPFVMLIFAYLIIIDGQFDAFNILYRQIGYIAENSSSLNHKDLHKLRGEFALLTAFTHYNNIKSMGEGMKQALEMLGGPSSIIINSIPWSLGSISVLSMFWRQSGKLEENLYDMEGCLSYYRKLTGGHCAGAGSVMRAEVMLMRGEDDEAEIMCHKALYEARSYKQISICLNAELVLAQIAILRGDVDGYFSAITNIQGYVKDNPNKYILRMAELCMSAISLTLGIKENIAQWLYDLDSIKKVLYSHSVTFALMLYSKLLLIEKKYSALFGISQFVTESTEVALGDVHYVMPKICHLIYIAQAKYKCGNRLEAQEHLNEALLLALPDKIYLPFAQQEGEMSSLLESTVSLSICHKAGHAAFLSQTNGSYADTSTDSKKSSFTDESTKSSLTVLKALIKRQERGAGVIKKAILQNKSSLTPREREIAGLAKERLSAKEIADKLYISEATVRTILRSVYSKLDIHSKSELNSKEF